MLAPIPYCDARGYKRRGKVRPEDVDVLTSLYPGYLEHQIARGSSWINSRLQKRYRVPLGQEAPVLVAAGALPPPPVTLSGRPTLGSLEMALQVTAAGPLGGAFRWSLDGGESWVTGVTAQAVLLGATGLTATFPAATYGADNTYSASTPVPEIALGWLAAMLDVAVWQRRGANPQDPAIVMAKEDRETALAEIKEAADSKEGLFELPTNDAVGDSAVNHGGPLCYTEASPYVSADLAEWQGRFEDEQRRGTYGGT